MFLARWAVVVGCLSPFLALGQIDPVPRELLQTGYNAALEGLPPLQGYAYYYYNQPGFSVTNLTLRVIVAPTYLDSELGIGHALSDRTDLGLGVAGGAFYDNYNEIDSGSYLKSQSFTGYGAEVNASLYHTFNPGALIPLFGVLRGTAHFSTYTPNDDTAPGFILPNEHVTYSVRTGLRLAGREPVLFPQLGLEVSAWYEASFRTHSGLYGFNDRTLEPVSQLFWGDAMLTYTLPEWKHTFTLGFVGGGTVQADRFSAYRLGGFLPLIAEFPLTLPGYFFQEISAKNFGLGVLNYTIPLDRKQRWNLNWTAASSVVSYLPGLEQPGNWNSGVGGGILYQSSAFKILLGYNYGFNAIRTDGRGAQSIGVLMQLDWAKAHKEYSGSSTKWGGIKRVLEDTGE